MNAIEIVSYTPEPELTIAVAARTCISDDDFDAIGGKLTQRDVDRILATVISKGHTSVLEHVSFTFSISGVSRVLSHQLVRHRIASYSQLSQQRTDASGLEFVTPPEIRKDPNLASRYQDFMRQSQELYRQMIDTGVAKGSARYVLPSGFTTRIIVTMNARSLFNLLAQRECAAEEWEFRQVATQMHRELMSVAPGIFKYAGPPCETDEVCSEGELGYTCGRQLRNGAAIANTRRAITKMANSAALRSTTYEL